MTVETREALKSNIDTDIANNTSGDISPEDVRENVKDLADSSVFPEDTPSVVNISSISDFPTPVANKITLDSNVVYHIHGEIDLEANSLVVPTTGASVSTINGARDVSRLTSSENSYTMFESPFGSYSGNLLLSDITITVGGVGSQVFNLDNDENSGALDIMGINLTSCTSLGELSNYRQLFIDNSGIISISDGLTLSGTWSGGITVVSSVTISLPASVTLFKEGSSLTFAGSIRSDMNFLNVDATSEFMDFQESNILSDEGVIISGFRTVANDAMPNLPSSSVKVKYTNCVGLKNTYIGGEYTITSSSTTTISSSSTLVKMAGTTTYNDMQWFSNTADNAFVYDSDQTVEIEVKGALAFSNSNNKVMGLQVRQWDDSASAYVNIGSRYTQTFNGTGAIEAITFFARATIDQNDRIEVWIENQTDTSNITAELGGFVGVSER